MSTPEATFFQLGNSLSLVQLITIGYELCGSYGLNDQADKGFVRKDPRSNPQFIKRYLDKCSRLHGIKTAKRASNYVVEGSASPMESLLSMLLCLPPLLGGFGLPLEYDSDTFHSSKSKLHLDSSRRSILEKAGIHVVSVTKNQVFDREQLFSLAKIVSRKLGKRLSPTPFDFAQKQDEIYRAAFK